MQGNGLIEPGVAGRRKACADKLIDDVLRGAPVTFAAGVAALQAIAGENPYV
jgi:hypothetical protein